MLRQAAGQRFFLHVCPRTTGDIALPCRSAGGRAGGGYDCLRNAEVADLPAGAGPRPELASTVTALVRDLHYRVVSRLERGAEKDELYDRYYFERVVDPMMFRRRRPSPDRFSVSSDPGR